MLRFLLIFRTRPFRRRLELGACPSSNKSLFQIHAWFLAYSCLQQSQFAEQFRPGVRIGRRRRYQYFPKLAAIWHAIFIHRHCHRRTLREFAGPSAISHAPIGPIGRPISSSRTKPAWRSAGIRGARNAYRPSIGGLTLPCQFHPVMPAEASCHNAGEYDLAPLQSRRARR